MGNNVDLRTLSRLRTAAIKKGQTEAVLSRCIQVLLPDSGKSTKDAKNPSAGALTAALKEVLLSALGGGNGTAKLDEKLETALQTGAKKITPVPEVTFFFAILVIDFCIKKAAPDSNSKLSFSITQIVVQLGNLNRRTLDFFAAKLYQYFARITNDSDLIRNDLLAIYRTACL